MAISNRPNKMILHYEKCIFRYSTKMRCTAYVRTEALRRDHGSVAQRLYLDPYTSVMTKMRNTLCFRSPVKCVTSQRSEL